MICPICDASSFSEVYSGPVRNGGVESGVIDGFRIIECEKCRIFFLYPRHDPSYEYYESDQYRIEYDGTIDEYSFMQKYDSEQNDRISKIGIENIRNKRLMDVGCGAGLFLDSIRGVARKVVAVEPMESFRKSLGRRGYQCYKSLSEVPEANVDIVVCFDTLEHIADPVSFLKGINRCIDDSGTCYISVPNKNDILMNIHKELFQKFFYCTAHLCYFDIGSLSIAMEKAGFQVVSKSGLHKYDFFNFVEWLKTDRPCGRGIVESVDDYFENDFKDQLIRLCMSSHIFIKAIKYQTV